MRPCLKRRKRAGVEGEDKREEGNEREEEKIKVGRVRKMITQDICGKGKKDL